MLLNTSIRLTSPIIVRKPTPASGGDSAPTKHLCQFTDVNAPVCGRRPAPEKPEGASSDPQWPFLVQVG